MICLFVIIKTDQLIEHMQVFTLWGLPMLILLTAFFTEIYPIYIKLLS